MQYQSRGELLLLSSEPSAAGLPAEQQLLLHRAVPGMLWANRGWCQGWARCDKVDSAVKVKIPRYDPKAGPVRIQLQNQGFCPGELLGILFLKTVLCIWTKSTLFVCCLSVHLCVLGSCVNTEALWDSGAGARQGEAFQRCSAGEGRQDGAGGKQPGA